MAQSQGSSTTTTTCSGPSQSQPPSARKERSGSGSIARIKPSGEREVTVESDAPPAPFLRRSTRRTNSTLATAYRHRAQANVAEKNSLLEAVKTAKKRKRVDGAMNEPNTVDGAPRSDVQDAAMEEENSREYVTIKAKAKATSSTTRRRESQPKASLAVGAPAPNAMTQLKKTNTNLKNGQKENISTSTKEATPKGKGKGKVTFLPPLDSDSQEAEFGTEDSQYYRPPPRKKQRTHNIPASGSSIVKAPSSDDFNVAIAFLSFTAAYSRYIGTARKQYDSTTTQAAASASSVEELETANVLLDLSTNLRVHPVV